MVSWQVDIPGLSQLVLNAGANGLKQLALSGVDVHTIGCMLMVSELIPVSQDFRHALNNSREKQRAERQWLYKVVEMGTGSFFLVDQFLKTRAGENVLALMASIVPLMSQDACLAVLGTLFEIAGASNDCTPGVSQFLRLREGLLTYVRNVGFQERVLQYHAFLDRISTAASPTTKVHGKRNPFDALPGKEDIARIIKLCHKVATSTENCVLTFSGFHGSGWLAAYAILILGLPVCALDSKGNQVPMNCRYGQAKVILNPSEEEGACKLSVSGQLSDFISVDHLDWSSHGGWSIDCKNVNFLLLNHPQIEDSQVNAVSEIVAIAALNCVARRARNVTHVLDHRLSVPYFISVLPQIQRRSLDILSLLGFRVEALEHYQASLSYLSKGIYKNSPQETATFESLRISARLDSDLDVLLKEIDGTRDIDPSAAETWKRAAWFASQLAYTDWNTKSQTISVQFAYRKQSPPYELGYDDVTGIRYGILEGPMEGLGQALYACTNATDARLFPDRWLAVDVDGLVVLRTLATCQSIHTAEGKILSFLPGHINFEGQKRAMVRMADEVEFDRRGVASSSRSVEPLNIVPLLRSRALLHSLTDTLWVSYEVFNGDDLLCLAQPTSIADGFRNLFVTKPCDHPYQTPIKDPMAYFTYSSRIGFYPRGCAFQDSFEPISGIYYQQTDYNDLGQWLACQTWKEVPEMKVLQLDTCLDCTISALSDVTPNFNGGICIIAGRKQELGGRD